MAYGINWFSEFADLEEKEFRVEILKRDFSGTPIKVLSSGSPINISWADDASSNPFHPIRTQKAEIQWVSDDVSGFDISDIFVIDHDEYKVRFGDFDEDDEFRILWEGYLVPTDCREPYQSKPYPVEMSASCGLALLRDQYFLDNDGKFIEGFESLMDILLICLNKTKLNLGVDVYLGLIDISGSNPIPLSQTYIDSDGLRGMTTYDVIEGIMNSINAYITQEDGRWVIKGIRELVAENIIKRSFNYDGTGYVASTVNQVSTIGRDPLSEGIPNLHPLSDVEESIATPSSIVTNDVSPGIAVNKLRNGTFTPEKTPWGVSLGSMEGWTFSHEPSPSWQVAGTGTPEDPYRFIMIGSVTTLGDIVYSSKKGNYQKNTTIFNSPAITIRRDGGKDFYPNIKIVVSGAFRMRDGGRLMISCRLNDGDRDVVHYLDENGKWTDAKNEQKRTAIKVTGDTPHNIDRYLTLDDVPLQTFEVTSERIPAYLNRPGGWIAKLYFSIHPVGVGSETFPEVTNDFSPAISLEDFCVAISTETAYEGEHYYQMESDTLIRNGEDYEYKTIIADKINILTAEQKHDDNRVMTGYLTWGIANLTKGWKRFVNGFSTVGAHEPLQHLTLRERLRLLCGKRRVLEGRFYGYGLRPTNAVINLLDGGSDSYHTITGYEWDVINREYKLRLHYLDFTPLASEVIKLKTDRKNNGRGNRMYQGASGTVGTGNGGPSGSDTSEDLVISQPDPFEYESLVADTSPRILDIAPLIESGHSPSLITAQIIVYPDWINSIYIYRGEDLPEDDIPDEGILEVRWTGTPEKSGDYRIVVEFVAGGAADFLLVIPIIVRDPTKNVSQVLDGETLDILGVVPGFFEIPELFNFRSKITGTHDKVVIGVSGGGTSGAFLNSDRTVELENPTDIGNYLLYADIDGVAVETGVYHYSVTTYRGLTQTSQDKGSFTLYDEEYLAKAVNEIYDTTKSELLGVISIDGDNSYKKPVSFDVKTIISELEHDKIHFTLFKDGTQVYEVEYTQSPAVLDAEYYLFDIITTGYGSGKYEMLYDVSLLDEPVYQRNATFEILDEEVKPTAGIDLIEFKENTINYSVVAALPLFNYQADLPDNWGLQIPVPTENYDYVEYKLYDSTSGGLIEVNIEDYTNLPQYISYSDGATKEPILVFDLKNSTDIGSIHRAPSSFRVKALFKLGGAAGKVTAIKQADFSFRVPLLPGDYSGVRFIVKNNTTSAIEVQDTDMPKLGKKYILPKYPELYSVSVRDINGDTFDKVIVRYSKLVSGSYVVLKFSDPGIVLTYDSPTDITELDSDEDAYVRGILDGDFRYLYNPSNEEILIDEVGKYKATFDFSLDGIDVGQKVVEFEIIDDTPEDLPIEDCCGGGGADLPTYPAVVGTWGEEFKIPQITITDLGTISNVSEIDIIIPGDEIISDVHNFDFAPKILLESTDANAAVTYNQLQTAVAVGSQDKAPVKTVATSNITLSGMQSINGYSTVAGDRVLVQNQTNATENGSYIALAGAWSRTVDANTGAELLGATWLVSDGDATVIGTRWKVTNTPPITIDTTPITIVQIQGAETDPTVPAWVKAITTTNITNWNTAYTDSLDFNFKFDSRLAVKTTNNLTEGTVNKYFTEQRVRDTVLTGLSTSNVVINPTDSVLSAFGKIQGQLDSNTSNLSAYVKKAEPTVISASHIFTGTELTLSSIYYHNLYLTSNTTYVHYYPVGGNGISNSTAQLRVWDSVANSHREIVFSGDGTFTWGGIGVVLANRSINNGVGLLGGGDLSANRTLSVNFGSVAGTVSEGNHTHTFASLTSKPTTLVGYGITDGVNAATLNGYVPITRSINVGLGILGGGALSQDRSISFDTTWGDLRYATLTYLGNQGFITANSTNTLTNKSGNISQWTNNVGYVVAATLNGYVPVSRSINVGTGILGGGNLSEDRSIAFDTTWGDARYATPAYVNGQGFITASSSNVLTNKSGNITQWTNNAGYVIATTLNGYVPITRSINVGTGILGGGALSEDRVIAFDTTWGDARYATLTYISGQSYITASSTNTLTNKSGNISQWTNNAGYITASSSSNLTNKTGLLSMWTNDAGFVSTDTLAATLGNFVRRDIASVISAGHVFTSFDLTLPSTHHRGLASNTAITNYFPLGGNGTSHSYASFRVHNADTGGSRRLVFGGDNSFTWDGVNVALQPWVSSQGYLTASSTATLTNKSGLLSMWTNDVGYISSVSLNTALGDYVSKTNPTTISAGHVFTSTDLTLSGMYFHQLYLNTANANYYPFGGNGGTHSFANLRVWDGAAGVPRVLTFGGDGTLTWGGIQLPTLAQVMANIASDINLTLAHTYYHNLSSNTVNVNYYPIGGNGGAHSFVNMKVYNSSTGGVTTLTLGGDGTFTWGGVNVALQPWVISQGYLKTINSGQVTGALGYTPYNASNPSGYISGINSGNVTSALGYTPMRDDRYITFNGSNYYINSNPNLGSFSGGVTGSGTTNYLAKWTGSGSIGNSRIQDTGSGEINITAGITPTHAYVTNTLTFGSGVCYGGLSVGGGLTVSGYLQPPVSTEPTMPPSPPEGSIHYVNTGTGKGLWCYMGSSGWRLMATRQWVGSSGAGSSPP